VQTHQSHIVGIFSHDITLNSIFFVVKLPFVLLVSLQVLPKNGHYNWWILLLMLKSSIYDMDVIQIPMIFRLDSTIETYVPFIGCSNLTVFPWYVQYSQEITMIFLLKLPQKWATTSGESHYSWLNPIVHHFFHGKYSDVSSPLNLYVQCSNHQTNGYGSIPIDTFLVGWTSIYQLFWGSLGTRVLTHPQIMFHNVPMIFRWYSHDIQGCSSSF